MYDTVTTNALRSILLAACLLFLVPQAQAQRQALSLDGAGYATAQDAPGVDFAGDATAITVEAWIKHDGQSDPDAIILNKGTDGNGYRLSLRGSGEEPAVRFAAGDIDSDFRDIVSNAGIPAGQWTHVAATYDGSQYTLYVNGELDNTEPYERAVGSNDDPLRIGVDNSGAGRFYSGEVDDIRIWSVGRPFIEMGNSPYEPPSGDEAGLVAYYTFDDATGTTVDDQAGSNDALTLAGDASLATPGIYPIPPRLFALAENGQVELSWDERLGDNGENEADAFNLYRSTQADGSDRQEIATISGGTSSYTDTDVDNGTTYHYQVTADEEGTASDYSKAVAARPYSTRGGAALTLEGEGYGTMSDRPSLDGFAQDLVYFDRSITVEAWIKHDGQSDEDAIIVNKGTDGHGYRLSFRGSGEEPAVRFAIGDIDSDFRDIISNAGIPAGQWTHVAATYDGAQYALYINGELDNTEPYTREVEANDDPLRIGVDNGGTGRFYSGQLDELRLWNSARTQEEIEATYREELVGNEEDLIAYFRFNDVGDESTQSAEGRHETMELLGDATVAAPGVFPLPPYGFALGDDASADVSWHERNAEDAGQYKVYRSTQADGSDRAEIATVGDATSFADTGVENDSLYFYEVTAIDADGQESDYSYVDPVVPSATSRGARLVLDGDRDFVTLSDRPSLDGYAQELVYFDQTITIEAWIRHDGQSDEDAIIVNKGTEGHGYRLSLRGSGDEPTVRFAVGDIDSDFRDIVSEAVIPAWQWTHVAATYDGSQYALYINGELDSTEDYTREVEANDNPLRIGADNGGTGRFYSGELDELRLWNSARTQEEIEAVYDQELVGDQDSLIAYFRFNERGSDILYSSATHPMTAEFVNDAALPSEEVGGALPEAFALEGNYPNPFAASSTVRYALPRATPVRLTVYDALGRRVATLVDAMQPAGEHEVMVDAESLPSGIYVYRLEAGGFSTTRKMTVVK